MHRAAGYEGFYRLVHQCPIIFSWYERLLNIHSCMYKRVTKNLLKWGLFRLCKYIFADQIFSFYSAHIYSFAVHCSWCSLIVLFFSNTDYFLPQKTNKKSWFLREITFFCETLLLSSNVFLETDQRSFTAAALKIWNVFSYWTITRKRRISIS